MNNKGKLFLTLAAVGGFLAFAAPKRANAADDEEEETIVPVGPPVQIPRGKTPDDFFGDAPVTIDDLLPKQPGEPPKFFPSPDGSGDKIPAPKPIPEDPEDEESENPVFTTQPVPVVKLPKVPAPVVTLPRAPAPAPVKPDPKAERPTDMPEDTAELLRIMLARETASDWKRQEPLLGQWQKARGLVADKKFGPKSALTMAEETGLLPIIRFWPKGAQQPAAVDAFQDQLLELSADAEQPRKAQLRAAAEREQGQGFGRNPLPITPTISI